MQRIKHECMKLTEIIALSEFRLTGNQYIILYIKKKFCLRLKLCADVIHILLFIHSYHSYTCENGHVMESLTHHCGCGVRTEKDQKRTFQEDFIDLIIFNHYV
jgi:hypothetical protein